MNPGKKTIAFHTRPSRGFTLIEVMVSVSVISVCFLTVMFVVRATSDNIGFELTVADQQVITRSSMDKMMAELRLMSDNYNFHFFEPQTGDPTLLKATPAVLPGGQPNPDPDKFLLDADAANASEQYGISQFSTHPTPNPGPRSITFGIPVFNEATGGMDYGSQNRCVTYRWVPGNGETPSNNIDDNNDGFVDEGRVERIRRYVDAGGIDRVDLQVVCDHVPQRGFLIEKNGRRLKITIARTNNTPRQTEDGTKFTTVVTHVTYCLKNQL